MKQKNNVVIGLVMTGVTASIILLMVFFNKLTKYLGTLPVWILLSVAVLGMTIFTAFTVKKLYDFYEVKQGFLRFVPCVCELLMLDIKFQRVSWVMYALAVVSGALALFVLPGNMPFYGMLVAMVCLAVIQIMKGIGLIDTYRDLNATLTKITGQSSGFLLGLFMVTAFFPFIRFFIIYTIDKMLTALTVFADYTASDSEGDQSALSLEME